MAERRGEAPKEQHVVDSAEAKVCQYQTLSAIGVYLSRRYMGKCEYKLSCYQRYILINC